MLPELQARFEIFGIGFAVFAKDYWQGMDNFEAEMFCDSVTGAEQEKCTEI